MAHTGKILITNDDGVEAAGIQKLAAVLDSAGYEIFVVAPDYNASGTGTSLNHKHDGKPISFHKSSIKGVKNQNIYGVDRPPAMCVMLTELGAFDFQPDLVVSGINAGLNTGRSVLFSGTVGAALAAQNIGLRGLALSVGKSPRDWQYTFAAEQSIEVIDCLLNGSDRAVVNMNVPPVLPGDLKGIRWGVLAPFNASRSVVAKQTNDQIELVYQPYEGYVPDEDSDLGITQQGYVALTALHGNSEVWSASVQPSNDFDPDVSIPAVTSGDQLTAARTFTIRN